jgi:hypothetical protein
MSALVAELKREIMCRHITSVIKGTALRRTLLKDFVAECLLEAWSAEGTSSFVSNRETSSSRFEES